MDAFTCRMSFTNKLKTLSASASAAKQCAQFALKNREYDEDLFSVILETLQGTDISMNVRVNILYFIDTLCESSQNAKYPEYIHLVQRDLKAIVSAVANEDPEGAINFEALKKVLENLKERNVIDEQGLREVEDLMEVAERRYREEDGASESDDTMSGDDQDCDGDEKEGKGQKRVFPDELIQQRMEEDRERHKRLRENIWQIPVVRNDEDDPEFEKEWEDASDLNEDDFEIMREENDILAAAIV